MFSNYLKIAFRNLIQRKGFSFVNIFGLTIGMVCTMLILLWVMDELSYDKFHKNANNIYRVVTDTEIMQSGLVATTMQEKLPEVKNTTRIYATKAVGRNGLVSYGEKSFYTQGLIMADPSFFDVFTYQFVKGNSKHALNDLKSIVITEETARKYFGKENPIGKPLMYENLFEFKVTGMLKNPNENTHLTFDFIIPIENYRTIRDSQNGLENWGNCSFATYVLLKENSNPEALQQKLQKVIEESKGSKYFPLSLQKITDIHLKSHFESEIKTNGDINSVYIFSTIAVFVLLIACINYMNLSTARSSTRAKEVGVRKVIGANRSQLVNQLLSESMLLSAISFLLALILVWLLLPVFNTFTGKQLSLLSHNSLFLIILSFVFIFGAGIIGGGYPAVILSGYNPVKNLKSDLYANSKLSTSLRFRNLLLVTQFVLSIGLIVCAFVISAQMDFIRNKNLGFKKEQLIYISSNRSKQVIPQMPLFKEEVLQSASVINASASSNIPGTSLSKRSLHVVAKPKDVNNNVELLWLDYDFLKTYEIKLAAGRSFSKEISSDATNAVIINETAAKELGFSSPQKAIGTIVTTNNETMQQIIGITKDFHFLSLYEKIPSIIMQIEPRQYRNLSVRIKTQNIQSTISFIKAKWQSVFPSRPFEYQFVDAEYEQQYSADFQMNSLFKWFAGVAIMIACLGLLSLVSFSIVRKLKEVGIRKVLGASVWQILLLITKEFIKWVIVANLIAWPIAYYLMNKWLQDFAYRIELSWWMFALSGGIALLIALATVSYQAIKAATANPVESLKYE
jgi:putative ABC transport system permease protein